LTPPRGVHESAAVGAKKSIEWRVQNEALMRSHFPGKELSPVAKLLVSNIKTIILMHLVICREDTSY